MQAELNLSFSTPTINLGSPSSEEDESIYEVCIANISPAERRKRLKFGIIQFVLSLIILATLLIVGADRAWRLVLILPFGAAAASYFQWRDKTWLSLAQRGSRQLTDKVEMIEDQSELKQVRLQARKILVKAFLISLALTLIALVLPYA